MEDKPFTPAGLEGPRLGAAWRAWARREEIKRSEHIGRDEELGNGADWLQDRVRAVRP
jgi:hypothetical protein